MKLFHALLNICFFISSVSCQDLIKSIKHLPDTGQNKSYTSTFGEDNDYTIFAPSFINHGNGTITDTVTGLMWQQTDGGEMKFENALVYVENLSLGGHDDWRLPTAFEAYTIQNHQNNNPALDINFFTKNSADYWWTTDKQKNDPNKIWVTNAGGGIGNHLKTETISAGGTKKYHVRAVRNVNPAILMISRFENINQDIVLDKLTGLIWEKRPNPSPKSWENAITYAENLTLAGYGDWRLPNIKELQSLQDVLLIQPCVNTEFFPSIGIKKYWSSTTLANQETRAWYFDTNFGITTYDLKSNANYVICTRGPIENNISGLSRNSITKQNINIYPNPASDIIHIKPNNYLNPITKILLLDLNGKILKTKIPAMGELELFLDTNNIQNGYYILKIVSKSLEMCEHVCIQKF